MTREGVYRRTHVRPIKHSKVSYIFYLSYRKELNMKTWSVGGIEKSREDWCKEYGISSVGVVMYRMDKIGLALQEALETPKKSNGRPRKGQKYAHIV